MENGQSVFSLASHALRACEVRALRTRKTLTPRFTDFFTDFEKKTDCFAVYDGTKCSEMMIYLGRWNKKTNKQNGRLLSFLFTFDPDT